MRKMISMGVLVGFLLAGCTGLTTKLSEDFGKDVDQSQKVLDTVHKGDVALNPPNDGMVIKEGLWLSGRTLKLGQNAELPAVFATPATFDRNVASLREFADHITHLSQIPSTLTADAVTASERAMQDGGGAGDSAKGAAPMIGLGKLSAALPPLPPGGINGDLGHIATVPIHIAYSGGDLRGLLDAASARFGVSWKYANGAAIPGDSTLNANVVSGSSTDGSGSSGSSGGGASTAGGSTSTISSANTSNTVMNSQLSVFSSIQASLKSMLSPYGSAVSSPATGSITVTDTPDVLDRVAAFMDGQNHTLSKQVLINVTVLSVTLSATDTYGINWAAVYQALGSKFSIGNTFAPAVSVPVAFTAQVLSPSTRASGTTAMISALSQQGKVRRKTSASVTTLNNQPVPVQVATEQGYLASISTTNTANVGSQTALTPGTVTTGFNMTLLPHVLDDGTVLLQFYTNISSLVAMQNITSGTGANAETIQSPEINTRNFMQRVSMRSGETLVLSGYEGLNDNLTQQGTGTPTNYAFGGGVQADSTREVIVILITPVATNGA